MLAHQSLCFPLLPRVALGPWRGWSDLPRRAALTVTRPAGIPGQMKNRRDKHGIQCGQ